MIRALVAVIAILLISVCQGQCWNYDAATLTHLLTSNSSFCLLNSAIPSGAKKISAFKINLQMGENLSAFIQRLPSDIESLNLGGNNILYVPDNFFQRFGASLKDL
jgi:hypothetical protein